MTLHCSFMISRLLISCSKSSKLWYPTKLRRSSWISSFFLLDNKMFSRLTKASALLSAERFPSSSFILRYLSVRYLNQLTFDGSIKLRSNSGSSYFHSIGWVSFTSSSSPRLNKSLSITLLLS